MLFVALQLYEDALILMADAGLSMMDSPQAVSWRAEALEGTGQFRAALAQLERGSRCSPMLEHSALLGRGSRCA